MDRQFKDYLNKQIDRKVKLIIDRQIDNNR